MHEKSLPATSARYQKRFGYKEQHIKEAVAPDMKVCMVIPCYHEPDICITLDSLAGCAPPRYPVEVLIIVNHSHDDTETVKSRNRNTVKEIKEWKMINSLPWLNIHVLAFEDFPPKHAGVGLARKIGMDEALYRFADINYCGMIVCLDADCTVENNYLQALEQAQIAYFPQSCTVYFEHDLQKVNDPALREGIIHYELFLRYYINALAYSHYPFAMHTVGSCMAVRADTYALSGGMNRRKAGEDFYFLHKIVPLGDYHTIQNTTVYPSARLSDRVPFGTGKAQQDWLKDKESRSFAYHPDTFEALKHMMKSVTQLYHLPDGGDFSSLSLPRSLQQFLHDQGFGIKLQEMKANSSNYQTFLKRFFSWFDGFEVLKFVHYCRDNYYAPLDLLVAGQQLVGKLSLPDSDNALELLEIYRRLDKKVM